MRRYDYIAAELYGYSYEHYQDKIDVHSRRFTYEMPSDAKLLEQAINESWTEEKIAEKLGIELDRVNDFKEAFHRAVKIVDSGSAYSKFEAGIRNTIDVVLEDHEIEKELKAFLIEQLLYQARDYEFLLKEELLLNFDDEFYSF